MKTIAVVAMNTANVPYFTDNEMIYTLENQKVWYTSHTKTIEIPQHILVGDYLLNRLIKKFLKKTRWKNVRDVLKVNYFCHMAATYLTLDSFDEVYFENEKLRSKIVPKAKKKNYIIKDPKVALAWAFNKFYRLLSSVLNGIIVIWEQSFFIDKRNIYIVYR